MWPQVLLHKEHGREGGGRKGAGGGQYNGGPEQYITLLQICFNRIHNKHHDHTLPWESCTYMPVKNEGISFVLFWSPILANCDNILLWKKVHNWMSKLAWQHHQQQEPQYCTLKSGGGGSRTAPVKRNDFFFIVLISKIMTIECITMPQTTTRFTVFFFKPSIRLSSLLWIHSFSLLLFLQDITNAARLYTGPTTGISMHLHTKNKRESSQWSISAQNYFFLLLSEVKNTDMTSIVRQWNDKILLL